MADKLHNGLSITNIKISCKSVKSVFCNEEQCLLYYTKYNLIVRLKSFTYTLLGKNKTHVNITGLKNMIDIDACIISLCDISNIVPTDLSNVKIDSISAVFSTFPGLKSGLISHPTNILRLYQPPRFCGLIIKQGKLSSTYFNSGRTIIVGCKSICQLNDFYRCLTNLFAEVKIVSHY